MYLLHVDFPHLLFQGLGEQHKGMGMASKVGFMGVHIVQLPGPLTEKNPMYSLRFCFHCREILNFLTRDFTFLFFTGPWKLYSGP